MKKWIRALCQPNLPLHQDGYVTACPAHIALSRQAAREGMVLLVALPLEEGRPFPLEALFCLGRMECVEGRRCVVYAFREEEPVLWEKG